MTLDQMDTNIQSTKVSTTNRNDKVEINDLAIKFNENLLEQGRESANKAFNIGCSVGLIPSLMFIIITLILTKGSWIATGLISFMMGLGVLALANLSAYIARSKTYQRIYQTDILPELEHFLETNAADRDTFEEIAIESLPIDSPLVNYFSISRMNEILDESAE